MTRRPKCKSRRFFPINVRQPGKRIKSISVKIDRKKQRVLRVKPRPRIQINLRGLPKRRVVVKIVIKMKDGRTIRRQRDYYTCTKKRPGNARPRI